MRVAELDAPFLSFQKRRHSPRDELGDQRNRAAADHDQNRVAVPDSQHSQRNDKQRDIEYLYRAHADNAAREDHNPQNRQRCGGNQRHDRRTQAGQDRLHRVHAAVFFIQPREQRHDDQRRQNAAHRRHERAGDARHADADKRRGINGNRAWGHLRDGHQIGKFAHRQPVIVFDGLRLYHRHGRVAAAD